MSQEVHGQRHHFQHRWFVTSCEFNFDPSELLSWRPKQAKYRSLHLIKAPLDRDAIT